MPRLLPDDSRAATSWLNYPGEISPPDPQQPLGPNDMREVFWPVDYEFDPSTGKTRVGLSLLYPPQAGDDE